MLRCYLATCLMTMGGERQRPRRGADGLVQRSELNRRAKVGAAVTVVRMNEARTSVDEDEEPRSRGCISNA